MNTLANVDLTGFTDAEVLALIHAFEDVAPRSTPGEYLRMMAVREAAARQHALAKAEGWHVDGEFPNPPDWEGAR